MQLIFGLWPLEPTLGAGALLRTWEWVFVLLKLVGAAYLVALGLRLALEKQA